MQEEGHAKRWLFEDLNLHLPLQELNRYLKLKFKK